MENLAQTFVTLGLLLLLGLMTDALGRQTPLPRVTLLLVFGFLIGPSVFDLLPEVIEEWLPVIATMALVMVGFLLGEKLSTYSLRKYGREVFWISVGEVIATAAILLLGLLLLGVDTDIALLLAGIATATAPAATVDVIHEAKARGPFSRTLMGVVAVDDAWGLLVFSSMLGIVHTLSDQGNVIEGFMWGIHEFGGALLVGLGIGVPLAFLTGRVQQGEPTLTEAVGAVFLCGGIALWLNVSFILASMVMGVTVANLARHHRRPFHAIEGIEWPFLILFFVLAGASLHLNALAKVGFVGVAYIVFRVLGRLVGAWVGGAMCGADSKFRHWMGMALMPQAGVALGMALVATQQFPQYSDVILPVVIGATVLFELSGPILTRQALFRMGEVTSDLKEVWRL